MTIDYFDFSAAVARHIDPQALRSLVSGLLKEAWLLQNARPEIDAAGADRLLRFGPDLEKFARNLWFTGNFIKHKHTTAETIRVANDYEDLAAFAAGSASAIARQDPEF